MFSAEHAKYLPQSKEYLDHREEEEPGEFSVPVMNAKSPTDGIIDLFDPNLYLTTAMSRRLHEQVAERMEKKR